MSELQRVATAGYIEVPDAFMERLTAYPFHKLEITEKNETLIISYKKNTIHDEEVVSMFRNKARNIFPKWAKSFPFNFHVRYYWSKDKGGIKYKILNPEVNLNWNWNLDIKASNLSSSATVSPYILIVAIRCVIFPLASTSCITKFLL